MLKCPSNFHSPKMRIFKPKFERPDLFVSPTLELWFHGLFWRLNLTGPYRTHRTHGPMGSWEGKISPAEMGALSTNRSFQFFKPAEVANFGGDERNKGGKFPPNSNFCWILEGIHLPSISHIFRVASPYKKKPQRTYVQLSTTSRSQRLREFHCFKKSLRSCGLRIPLFHLEESPALEPVGCVHGGSPCF